jgi:hypothetical protein
VAAAAAAAALAEAIELKQDEAEEILLSIDVTILSISEMVTTKKIASEVCRKVEDATAALTRCHVFLLRRDRANHEADLGRRIKDALAQLSDVLVMLTALMDKEPEPRAAPAAPAAPPPPDQGLVNSTQQAVTRVATKLEGLNKEAKKFLKADPKEDDDIFQAAEMMNLLGGQIDAACSEGAAVAERAITCRLYDLELHLTTLVNTAEAGKVACLKALMEWKRELASLLRRGGASTERTSRSPSSQGSPRPSLSMSFVKTGICLKQMPAYQ